MVSPLQRGEIARHPAPGGLERLFSRMAAGDDFEQSLIAATGLSLR
jgi:hypothetical protein